jgi:GGDEF domain-containing protein
LLHDLAEAVHANSPPQTLAIFDLRGYVETYGRMGGEDLLRQLAGHFREALQGTRLYRPRESEFALLLDGAGPDAEQQLADAVAALMARFGQFKIEIAFGAASLPLEAGEPIVAMKIADSRHYLRKSRRRERRLVPRSGN